MMTSTTLPKSVPVSVSTWLPRTLRLSGMPSPANASSSRASSPRIITASRPRLATFDQARTSLRGAEKKPWERSVKPSILPLELSKTTSLTSPTCSPASVTTGLPSISVARMSTLTLGVSSFEFGRISPLRPSGDAGARSRSRTGQGPRGKGTHPPRRTRAYKEHSRARHVGEGHRSRSERERWLREDLWAEGRRPKQLALSTCRSCRTAAEDSTCAFGLRYGERFRRRRAGGASGSAGSSGSVTPWTALRERRLRATPLAFAVNLSKHAGYSVSPTSRPSPLAPGLRRLSLPASTSVLRIRLLQ